LARPYDSPDDHRILAYVLACDLHDSESFVGQIEGKDIRRRVRQNQDERYHCLNSVGETRANLRAAVMDFRMAVAISTVGLYQGIIDGSVARLAIVPPIYLHDMVHRFYAFLSRVGLPDE